MEKGFSSKKKNVLANQKEVFKDLEKLGRDSPESGSLYSDYESGQQYEDKVKTIWVTFRCKIFQTMKYFQSIIVNIL